MKRHILVLDPTPFAGGSKVATLNILRQLSPEKTRITVLSNDPNSWVLEGINHCPLREPKSLCKQEQGVSYFIRHQLIALQIMLLQLHHGQIDVAVGASGPGVDLALYLAKPLLRYQIVQLIHGPVATSRTIARCLRQAKRVYFLESSRDSLLKAMKRLSDSKALCPPRFELLQNGLPSECWPSPCQTEKPVIFWAASLLKWKGLDLLLEALKRIDATDRPESHICYIRPQGTDLPISQAPIDIDSVYWHHAPKELDTLRAGANIFVSTSDKEPFGLSILEAMAAGHCVVIPADGAYWDRTLQDGINCIKYRPGDSVELANKLHQLSGDMPRVKALGEAARHQSQHYRAEQSLKPIIETLEGDTLRSSSHHSAQHKPVEIEQ